MKSLPPLPPFPKTPELLGVARRVVWFKSPEDALADPRHFLAHVMTYGAVQDLKAIETVIGQDDYRQVLDNPPPGVFDPRSWAYWNLRCGRSADAPLPGRKLE